MRGLIGETLRLLRVNWRAMLLVAVVFLVPAELAVAYVAEDSERLGIAAYSALTLIAYPWVVGALTATLAQRGRSPVEPYGRVIERLPALVVAGFLCGLAVLVGLLLLIVPGLLLAARWSAAVPLIVLERQSFPEALGKSNSLVRGRTWTVVGALAIVLVVSLLVSAPAFVGSLSDTVWVSGLSAAAIDVLIFLPGTALGYAVYKEVRVS